MQRVERARAEHINRFERTQQSLHGKAGKFGIAAQHDQVTARQACSECCNQALQIVMIQIGVTLRLRVAWD